MIERSRGCHPPQPRLCSASFSNLAKVQSGAIATQRCPAFIRLTLSLTGGWIVSTLAPPVHAATLINNSGVRFDQDTTIESKFIESHGAYQSTFGVINLDTKEKTPLLIETKPSDYPESIFKPSSRRSHIGTKTDFLGTPGNAVPKPTAQYNFRANQRYVLYLESSYNGRPTGIVYSTNVLNPSREQQVKFAGDMKNLCSSGVTVGWDDTGSKLVRDRQQQDRDFDDFVVQMKSMSCGIGGGEPPLVEAANPVFQPVHALPAVATGSRFPYPLLLLLALPAAFIGGGGGKNKVSNSTPPGTPPSTPPVISPSIPPTPPQVCPSGNCKAVPEPITILGSGSAIAVAALIERRRKRKRR